MTTTPTTFKARDFAQLAGVTVRALHHYDRIGLLKPRRTSAGYRIYSMEDLQALEQIVVLKFIGIPLREIAALRRSGPGRLAESLRAQRGTLQQKRHLLDRAIAAIQELEAAVASRTAEPIMFKRIIEVIEMQDNAAAWKKQYDELVNKKIARLQALSPEEMATLRTEWNALVAEIRSALNDDPASPMAQALGSRWRRLLARLMGEAVSADTLATHHTAQEWTPQMARFVDKSVWDFMTRVLTSRA